VPERMKSLNDLKIQLYADGADKAGILDLYAKPYIKGLTTNPSLMKKAGIHDYEAFAKDILQTVTSKPISLEVFTDEFPEMKRQALKITAWGGNVYTKIPITNARGESSLPLIRELAQLGVKLNVTALFTLDQVRGVAAALNPEVPSVVSVFAGRIADTGVDPAGLPSPSQGPAQGGAPLGEHARGAQHLPGGSLWNRDHHGAPRHPRQGRQAPRHGPGCDVARHGPDVLQGRDRRRVQDLAG